MITRKTILIIIAGIIGGAAVIALFFYSVVRNIAQRLDCERFNIDNVELRTQTNIPDLKGDVTCIYSEALKVKTNYFIIDTGVDMRRYIWRNKFRRVEDSAPRFVYQQDWNEYFVGYSTRHLYTKSGVYIGKESGKKDSWTFILDTSSREVWMELIRTDPAPEK